MGRKTLVCVFIDNNKHFCIRNRNTDYFSSDFNKYFNIIDSDDISICEETVRLNKFFSNNNFEVISVIDAENKSNKDQKQITMFKDYYQKTYEAQGYVWDKNVDEFKVEYNNTEENDAICKAIINYRNLATLYTEKLEDIKADYKRKVENIKADYNKKVEQYKAEYDSRTEIIDKNYNDFKTEYDNKLNTLQYEVTYNEDRLTKLKEENDVLNSLIKEKKEQSKVLGTEINSLTEYIRTLNIDKTDVAKKYNEQIKAYTAEVNRLKIEKNVLAADIESLKEDIDNFTKRSKKIYEELQKHISNHLKPDEINKKIDDLILMVQYNNSFYHNTIPDFEVDYLVQLGIDKELIVNRLKLSGITIRKPHYMK